MSDTTSLAGRFVFLSASYPPRDYKASSDSHEIARAIKMLLSVVFEEKGLLTFGGHPSISPLVLMMAREYGERNRVRIYQSALYADRISPATHELRQEGYGEIVFTPAIEGEKPAFGKNAKSLARMREQMVTESNPVGAVFIGGDTGVTAELDLFQGVYPNRPVIPIGAPGGIAKELLGRVERQLLQTDFWSELYASKNYLSLMRKVVLWMERPSHDENRPRGHRPR
jgi:hypothetical protein